MRKYLKEELLAANIFDLRKYAEKIGVEKPKELQRNALVVEVLKKQGSEGWAEETSDAEILFDFNE